MELLPWIKIKKLDPYYLAVNPVVISVLQNNSSWKWLSSNPAAQNIINKTIKRIKLECLFLNDEKMALLLQNPEKIDWVWLSCNPTAIHLLKANKDKIDWNNLSNNSNPAAINLLSESPDKINWDMLSCNPAAIELLKANQNKINWRWLSLNTAAMSLLKENPDKIDWDYLSINSSAIGLLKENLNKIHWRNISMNPLAINILRDNPDKINWNYISRNPAIFTYKYSLVTLICSGIIEKIPNNFKFICNSRTFNIIFKYLKTLILGKNKTFWSSFLCEGIYDPRLLIYICNFAGQWRL